MAHPYHHAVSSARRFGGVAEDYQHIHDWFDETKSLLADVRHRALRHHAEGIFLCERIFGVTIDVTIGYTVVDDPKDKVYKEKGDAAFRARDLHNLPPTAAFEQFVVRNTKKVPTRWVGEQHVREDLGRVPEASEWLKRIAIEPWMNDARRLSRELEATDKEVVPNAD